MRLLVVVDGQFGKPQAGDVYFSPQTGRWEIVENQHNTHPELPFARYMEVSNGREVVISKKPEFQPSGLRRKVDEFVCNYLCQSYRTTEQDQMLADYLLQGLLIFDAKFIQFLNDKNKPAGEISINPTLMDNKEQ